MMNLLSENLEEPSQLAVEMMQNLVQATADLAGAAVDRLGLRFLCSLHAGLLTSPSNYQQMFGAC